VGIYSKYIFPLVLDWSLNTPEIGEHRRRALAPVRGETLEIGFGTGLNLPFYPQAVTKLTVIDSEKMRQNKVKKRIASSTIPVASMRLDATKRLPFDDHMFDSVVTTLTLCSIADTASALAEIRRVLKSDGRFIFFEHGRSSDPVIARRQDRFNPIQRVIAAGCHLNRPIDQLIEFAGFELVKLDRFLMPKAPRILAEIYCGIAAPPR